MGCCGTFGSILGNTDESVWRGEKLHASQTGFNRRRPKTTCCAAFQATTGIDRDGRAVFAADADKIPSSAPPMDLRLRCIFASLQILSDNCRVTSNFEIVNLTRINPQQMVKMVKQEIELVQDLLETALCVNTPAINLVIESNSPKRTIMKTLIPIILAKVGNFMSKIPMVVHLGTPSENLCNLLNAHSGLKASLIPTSFGGTWSYDNLKNHKLLQRVERTGTEPAARQESLLPPRSTSAWKTTVPNLPVPPPPAARGIDLRDPAMRSHWRHVAPSSCCCSRFSGEQQSQSTERSRY